MADQIRVTISYTYTPDLTHYPDDVDTLEKIAAYDQSVIDDDPALIFEQLENVDLTIRYEAV